MRNNTKLISGISVVLLMGFIFMSCATVFKGSQEYVDLRSDPIGAKVYINGSYEGTTPVELHLESNKTYHIEFKKDGYQTKTYTLTNHLGAGWVILDVICGLVPVVVDAITGAWYKLDENDVGVTLEK
ncbi:MAG: PEGA domain-containing protein [bacterium]